MTFPLAEVVPLVPAAGALVGYFFSLLLFALVTGLVVAWVHVGRPPLVHLGNVSVLTKKPFGFLLGTVANVDRWLDATQKGTERAMTWSLHALMTCISTGVSMTKDLADAVYHAHIRLRRHQVKTIGAKVPVTFEPRLAALEREWKGIDARLDRVEHREQAKRGAGAAAGAQDFAQLRRGIDRLNKRVGSLAHELDAVEHAQAHVGAKAKTGDVAVPRVVPRVVPRTRAPSRHWTNVLTKTAAAALVVAALARAGLGWLRCNNVGKLGKAVCGVHPRWLDDFLAGMIAIVGATSVVEFVEEAQAGEHIAIEALQGFVRELKGLELDRARAVASGFATDVKDLYG